MIPHCEQVLMKLPKKHIVPIQLANRERKEYRRLGVGYVSNTSSIAVDDFFAEAAAETVVLI